MSENIVNKVAESGLVTIDLENFLPKEKTEIFDLKDHLYMGMILKEKDFREALKTLDWEKYRDKNVAITCTADAVVPLWAYMLVVTYLQPIAAEILTGTEKDLYRHLFLKNITSVNSSEYAGKRVVIKGCGDNHIDEFAYAEITRILVPVAKSIMYGEPCSTVPVFKRK